MTVIMLIKNLEKEKIVSVKLDYLCLMDFLEYLYYKGAKYKILRIIKHDEVY